MSGYFLKRVAGVILSISLLYSCKKDSPPVVNPDPINPTASREELSKDSIFLYSKELYFWNTSLPTISTFNPRGFDDFEDELYAITKYAINPSTGRPYEYINGYDEPKFSYIEKNANANGNSSKIKADLDGLSNDFGFSVKYYSSTSSTSDAALYVTYAYSGSSAAQNGLTRGCKILSINNNNNLDYSNQNINFINDAVFGDNTTISIKFQDLAGQIKDVTINNTQYNDKPILHSEVKTIDSKKIGYIVYNSFTSNSLSDLNDVFNDFTTNGITELIVDLRYNGGGYISTASEMINLIVPSAQTNNTMFTYYYNSYLQNLTSAQRRSSVLIHQPILDSDGKVQAFSGGVNGLYATYADLDYRANSDDNIEKFRKSGTLNLSRVFFLVGASTASSSELVINALKPVMDVKLIGRRTYGKPVGFFPIRIDDFDLFIPEFETKNKNGEGNYYDGFEPNKSVNEDVSKAWGDNNELLLANALSFIKTGNYLTTGASMLGNTNRSATGSSQKITIEEERNNEKKLSPKKLPGLIRTPKILR